jgi:hypothetical protein
VEAFEADWSMGKRAGPERNGRMVESASGRYGLVVLGIFPGGSGTADIQRQASYDGSVRTLRVFDYLER